MNHNQVQVFDLCINKKYIGFFIRFKKNIYIYVQVIFKTPYFIIQVSQLDVRNCITSLCHVINIIRSKNSLSSATFNFMSCNIFAKLIIFKCIFLNL